MKWHARRDSNPQPAVLETAALPIELLAYIDKSLTDLPEAGWTRFQPRSSGLRLSSESGPLDSDGEPLPTRREVHNIYG